MSPVKRFKVWSDGKKWWMGLSASLVVIFIVFVSSGANDGRQALKKACDLEAVVDAHKEKSNKIISSINERVARTETKVDMILEIVKKQDK